MRKVAQQCTAFCLADW